MEKDCESFKKKNGETEEEFEAELRNQIRTLLAELVKFQGK